MNAYAKACLARHNGNHAAAIRWLETERAQAMYIEHNARHAATVTEARGVIDRMTAALDALRVDSLPDLPAYEAGTLERVVTAICGTAVAAGALCFAMALATPARATETGNTPQAMAIYAVDTDGGEWIIGSGDTCETAAQNAKRPPAQIEFVECAPYQLESK